MAKAAKKRKRGRPPGKVGPYKMNLSRMMEEIKALRLEVNKMKKVLN